MEHPTGLHREVTDTHQEAEEVVEINILQDTHLNIHQVVEVLINTDQGCHHMIDIPSMMTDIPMTEVVQGIQLGLVILHLRAVEDYHIILRQALQSLTILHLALENHITLTGIAFRFVNVIGTLASG